MVSHKLKNKTLVISFSVAKDDEAIC